MDGTIDKPDHKAMGDQKHPVLVDTGSWQADNEWKATQASPPEELSPPEGVAGVGADVSVSNFIKNMSAIQFLTGKVRPKRRQRVLLNASDTVFTATVRIKHWEMAWGT